jgi:hypothetical protein
MEPAMLIDEAKITIDGKELTEAQSMAVRVAISGFLFELGDPKFARSLGPIAVAYRLRLTEVIHIIGEGVTKQQELRR